MIPKGIRDKININMKAYVTKSTSLAMGEACKAIYTLVSSRLSRAYTQQIGILRRRNINFCIHGIPPRES